MGISVAPWLFWNACSQACDTWWLGPYWAVVAHPSGHWHHHCRGSVLKPLLFKNHCSSRTLSSADTWAFTSWYRQWLISVINFKIGTDHSCPHPELPSPQNVQTKFHGKTKPCTPGSLGHIIMYKKSDWKIHWSEHNLTEQSCAC